MSLGSFAQGLGQGVQTGKQLRDIWDARGLSKDLGAIDDARNPVTPEPGEDGSVGESYYEVGGQKYFTKEAPPDYLWEADRLQRQADAYRKRGRPDDAVNLQDAARERLKTGQAEHFSALSNRVKPLFFDDTGRRRSMDEVMADPTQRDALLSVMNDPAFDSVRNVGGNAIRVSGMTPLGDGRAALDLDVIDPSTGRVVRRGPATEGRSSDPDDVVAGMTAERLFSGIQDRLRGGSPDYAKLDDANRSIAGRESLIRGVVGDPGLGAAGSAPSAAGSAPVSTHHAVGALTDYAVAAAGRFDTGMDPSAFADLASRVMWQESRGDPNAVSSAGARGLMQLMPGTARDPGFGIQGTRDDSPEENMRVGTEYLAAMLKRYGGNVDHALIAYNFGPGEADDYVAGRRDSLPEETRDYLRIVGGGFAQGRAQPAPSAQPSAPRAPGGLDSAIAMGARYPDEVGLADIERVGATGSVAEPKVILDGRGGATAVNPNDGRGLWSVAGRPETGTARTPRFDKGKDGSVTARDPQTGEELWSAPGEKPSEKERLSLQKDRRNDVQHQGELMMGEFWTPRHYTKTITTLDALGLPYGMDKLEPIMATAVAITEAFEAKDRITGWDYANPWRWGNKNTKFDSYTLGITAAGMGMRASDESEIAKKLVEPMQAITGGKGMSAADQAIAFGSLAVAQGRFRYTTTEATKLAATNVEYGVTDEEFAVFIEAEGKLAPEDYSAMLKEQADRDNAN